MIVSDDATIWSVTYDRHYDDRNSFIIQATGQYFQVRILLKSYCNNTVQIKPVGQSHKTFWHKFTHIFL